jgi:NADPH:quinone reductase-like Zn-dependent oxidoreductase
MTFKVLNIENDPIQQGFEPEQYDIVVAANVFHATKSIDTTLKNARKLMKKGGILILHELTNNTSMQTGFGFGLLPGWWLSVEPYREWGPLLDVSDWSKHMERAGFTGVDISFPDYPGIHNQRSTLMISTVSGGEPKVRGKRDVVIITGPDSKLQQHVAQGISKSLLELGIEQCAIISTKTLQDETLRDKACIFLADIESPFLHKLSQSNFDNLKRLITTTNSLFWLTQGGGKFCDNPNAELVTGLARTVRSENPSIQFVTFSVDQNATPERLINTATSTFDAIFLKANNDIVDNTFADVDGVIHVPRIVEADYMNQAISAKTTLPRPHSTPFGIDPSRALKLVVGSPGLLNTLRFVDDPVYDVPLKPNEVEYKVMVSGLNFLDVMVSLGQVLGNHIGVEGAGVVTRVGSDTPFKPGDRVCGLTKGALNSFARTIATNLVKMPDNLSFVSAATLPIVFSTAYCCLYEIANIQKGETVLIHAAAGGVGQACIQLAQLRGAEIYATVSSIEKRTLLEQEYGIPRDHIFSSRDLTFQQGIKRMTKKRGVDVIVNALSGPALRASWECIAPFGRFVEIGKVDIYTSARLNMGMFKNNVRFEFVDVGFLSETQEQRLQGILKSVMQLAAERKISELRPVTVYPLSRLEEALRYMQSGAHSGKIVVEMKNDDIVMVWFYVLEYILQV